MAISKHCFLFINRFPHVHMQNGKLEYIEVERRDI